MMNMAPLILYNNYDTPDVHCIVVLLLGNCGSCYCNVIKHALTTQLYALHQSFQ